MIAVVQRVSGASVAVDRARVAQIGRGLVVLLGVARGDTEAEADKLAEKIVGLRIMPDRSSGGAGQQGKMNQSIQDIGGEILVVSQFTLLADASRGRRPSFIGAAEPKKAERLYRLFIERVKMRGIKARSGRFGEYMEVKLTNDGPVTVIVESKR